MLAFILARLDMHQETATEVRHAAHIADQATGTRASGGFGDRVHRGWVRGRGGEGKEGGKERSIAGRHVRFGRETSETDQISDIGTHEL